MLLSHALTGDPAARRLVLTHSITESRVSWQGLLPALEDRFHVLAVDLRGHGASPVGASYTPVDYAGDVVETMAHVGWDRALLVGHSLGAITVSAMAAAGVATAVVNVDQSLRLAAFKAQLAPLEAMLRGPEDTFQAVIAQMFDALAGPLGPEDRAHVNAHRRADQAVVLGTWDTVFASSEAELDATVEALATAVTVPYLSLFGADPGEGYSAWLTALVPTAVVEVWPDHGHYPHLVDRGRFLARLDAFAAGLRD